MTETSKLIDKIKKRHARGTPTVADALLAIKPYGYLAHRLKFYTANRVYLVALHVIEFLTLLYIMAPQSLGDLIVFIHILSLVTAFSWGLLEGQRRAVVEATTPHRKSLVLDGWFTGILSVCVGILSVWVAINLFFPVDSFVMQIGTVYVLRGCFDLISRCRYSGLFAVQRVYRPFVIVVALESLGILSAAASVYWFSYLNIAALLGASAILSFLVEWRFASRDYLRLRIKEPRFRLALILRLPVNLMRPAHFAHGLYMVSHKASSLYVLVTSYHAQWGALPLLFHLTSPVLNMSANWVQSLYFDFRRYRNSIFENLLSRFSWAVLKVSVVYGLLCGVLAAILIVTVITWQAYVLVPYFLLLVVTRAVSGAVVTSKFDHTTVAVPLFALLLSTGIPAIGLLFTSEASEQLTLSWLIGGQMSVLGLLFYPRIETHIQNRSLERGLVFTAWQFFGMVKKKIDLGRPGQVVQVTLDLKVLRRRCLEQRLDLSSDIAAYVFLRPKELLLLLSETFSMATLRLIFAGSAESLVVLTEEERNDRHYKLLSEVSNVWTTPINMFEVAKFPASGFGSKDKLKDVDITAREILIACRRYNHDNRPVKIRSDLFVRVITSRDAISSVILYQKSNVVL